MLMICQYRTVFVKFVSVLFFKALPFIGFTWLNLYLSIVLDEIEYGQLGLMINGSLFLGPILTLGLTDIVFRKISVFNNRANYRALNIFWGSVVTIFSSISLFFLFIIYVVDQLKVIDNKFFYILYMSPILGLSLLISNKKRGTGEFIMSVIFENSLKYIYIVSGIVSIFLLVHYNNVLYFLMIPYCVFFITYVIFNEKPKRIFMRKMYYYKIIMSSSPILLILLIQGVKNFGDSFIVAFILGEERVGAFLLAFQLALIISIVQMIISYILGKSVAVYFSTHDYPAAMKLYNLTILISLSFAITYILLFYLFGEFVIEEIYGDKYIGLVDLVYILTIGRVIHLICGPCMQFLVLSNNASKAAKVSLYCGFAGILLSIVLTYFYGIYGAAFSASIILSVWALWLRYELRLCIRSVHV